MAEKLLASVVFALLLRLGGVDTGNSFFEDVFGGVGLGDDEGFAAGGGVGAVAGGRLIRVAEGGFDEMVVTTDPGHSDRTARLLGAFIERTGIIPELAAGGFVSDALAETTANMTGGAVVQNYYNVAPQIVLPNIRDQRGFQLNRRAIEREVGRSTLQTLRETNV